MINFFFTIQVTIQATLQTDRQEKWNKESYTGCPKKIMTLLQGCHFVCIIAKHIRFSQWHMLISCYLGPNNSVINSKFLISNRKAKMYKIVQISKTLSCKSLLRTKWGKTFWNNRSQSMVTSKSIITIKKKGLKCKKSDLRAVKNKISKSYSLSNVITWTFTEL